MVTGMRRKAERSKRLPLSRRAVTKIPVQFPVSAYEQNLGFREAGSSNAAAVGKTFQTTASV